MLSYGTHPKRWQDVKICTYAMCKNELKFVESWVKNVWNDGNGSDYITVLDTGSTDGTWECLQTIGEKLGIPEGHLIVGQEITQPWRFDIGRNNSMKLIPYDKIDACFCLDLDEEAIPDFWIDYKKLVFEHPDFYRIYYYYAWSLKSDGSPNWYFWYDKTHGPKGWQWEYPVHETLKCSCVEEYDGQIWYMDANKIYIKHHPDKTKSRGNYINLIKLRAEENPTDITSSYYLAREYSYYSRWEETIGACDRTIELIKATGNYDSDPELYGTVVCLAGEASYYLDKRDQAIEYFNKAIDEVPEHCRAAFIWKAQTLAYSNKPDEALATLDKMHHYVPATHSWRVPGWINAKWKEMQIVADAESWKGNYSKAYNLMLEAEKFITDLERDSAIAQGFYTDLEFIKSIYDRLTPHKEKSWVTLLFENSYIAGEVGVVKSLQEVNTKYPIACLVTPNISENNRKILKELSVDVIEIPYYINEAHKTYIETSPEVQRLKTNGITWTDSISKLQIFNLTQYDKIVYIDNDVRVIKNMDEVFEFDHGSACGDMCGYADSLCAGMLVINPNADTYSKVCQYTAERLSTCSDTDCISDNIIIKELFNDIWINNKALHIPSKYNWWSTFASLAPEDVYSWHYVCEKPWNTPLHKIYARRKEYDDNEEYYTITEKYAEYLNECLARIDTLPTDWHFISINKNPVKFTVVIPYHHEPFTTISPLLQSIDGQVGFNFNSLEILICSNDGIDNKFDLSQFLNIRDKVQFFSRKYPISGPGQSRQIGLEAATGEYITFYDCDDTLYAMDVYNKAFNDIDSINNQHIPFDVINFNYLDEVYGELIYQTYTADQVTPYVQWCAIYKRDYLISNHLFFNTDIAISEDVYFTLNLLLFGTKYVHSDVCMYIHRMVKESTGNTWIYTPNRLFDTNKLATRLMETYYDTIPALANYYATDMYYEAVHSTYEHTNGFENYSPENVERVYRELVNYINKYDSTFTHPIEVQTSTPEIISFIKQLYEEHKNA